VNFDGFHPYVLPLVGNCPTQTIDFQVRQAAIEFCDDAAVWVERLDTLLTDAHRNEYALPIDDQAALVKLLEVRIDDERTEIAGGGPGGVERRRMYVTRPTAWLVDRETLRIEPPANQDQALDVFAQLKPSQAAFTFDDKVFAHHAQHIAHGALCKLFRIPGQPWTDMGLADYYAGLFKLETASQARIAERAYARATQRGVRFY
jgi:hypothetical protein